MLHHSEAGVKQLDRDEALRNALSRAKTEQAIMVLYLNEFGRWCFSAYRSLVPLVEIRKDEDDLDLGKFTRYILPQVQVTVLEPKKRRGRSKK